MEEKSFEKATQRIEKAKEECSKSECYQNMLKDNPKDANCFLEGMIQMNLASQIKD